MNTRVIEQLKNMRMSLANKDDHIMHVAVVFKKNMDCLLCGWNKQ